MPMQMPMEGTLEQAEVPRRRAGDASRASRRRHLFFSLASLWGYLLGIGVLAVAQTRGGAQVRLDGTLALWLAVGSLLGMAGGIVAAGAYREARRRSR